MKVVNHVSRIMRATALAGVLGTGCLAERDADHLLVDAQPIALMQTVFTRPAFAAERHERQAPLNMLVQAVRGANMRIDMWCYGLDEPGLLEALRSAKERGITLNILGSPDQTYRAARAAGLDIALRNRSGLQHVKLLIIDDRLVISGTGNLTRSGLFHNNNAFFRTRVTPSSARALRQLLEREGAQASTDTISAGHIELKPGLNAFVAPGSGPLIQTRFVHAILAARVSIQVMMFSHTDAVLTAALLLQAARGVIVEVVYDLPGGSVPVNSEASRLNRLLGHTTGIVYADGNRSRYLDPNGGERGGHLHHKTLIVDGTHVLFGSYNWSRSARDKNLEVMFETEDLRTARDFTAEFHRVRSRAAALGRSPLATNQGRTDWWSPDDGSVCQTDPGRELVIFSGRGPFLRAVRFRGGRDIETDSGCHETGSADGLSAGAYRALGIGSGDRGSLQMGTDDLYLNGTMPSTPSVCQGPQGCRMTRLLGLDLKQGVIVTNSDLYDFSGSVRIISATGSTANIPVLQTGPGVLHFTPPAALSGDAVALLLPDDPARPVVVGCLNGAAASHFDGQLLRLLDALLHTSRNTSITCALGA